MKLVMYGEPYQERPGVLVDDTTILDLEREDLESPHSLEEILDRDLVSDIRALLDDEKALRVAQRIPLAGTRLGPPLSVMGKIIACGLNYREHAQEMGDTLPVAPLLFAKAPSSIAGPYDDLVLPPPAWSQEIDYEVELAVVIGHLCEEVSEEDALAYVAGYTILNDVTARDIQRAESQWFRAKSYNGFCPVGPYLVTADEVCDPQALALWTTVNGQTRQHSTTASMIFTVAQLVSFVSHTMTLLPGDIIATGTPSGIGAGMAPPTYLQPGDMLEMGVEGLGAQRIQVVSATSLPGA
jgi:2,4-didehydro-3-deoxy-L-rhamnonate hydrolase